MSYKILVVKPNYEYEVKELQRKELSDGIRKELGGWMEIVRPIGLKALPGLVFCVDEEGLYKRLEPNVVGITLYTDLIVGNIVFIREELTNGGIDFASLNDLDISYLKQLVDVTKQMMVKTISTKYEKV